MTNILSSDDSTLVIGDEHVSTGQKLNRADLLGKAIKDIKPTRIVHIGDLMTFDVFSAWDRDKRKKMDAGLEYLDRIDKASGGYKCEVIMTEGNHEDRLWRYIDHNPEMEGAIDYVRDLNISHWNIIPYKGYYNYKGVGFTHIPINGAGKPIGGKYVCTKALELHQGSTVFGHTHRLCVDTLHRHGGRNLNQALNVGCFFNHTDEYAQGSQTSYWRGLVLLDHYKQGRFGWQPISMGKLRKAYQKTKGK
jgi:predicted phosphodiesterase